MFDAYLESFDFLKHKFKQLKRRQINFTIDEKLKSKKNTSQKKRNTIKKELNQKFIELERKAFRSNIYIRIVYYYNDSNPPTAVNATKNILDLMHVNVNQANHKENVGVIRARLPYYDDSQVTFLSVRQNIEMDSAEAYVLIENFNSILQYANILSCLKSTKDIDDHISDDAVDFSEKIYYPENSLGYKIEMYRRQKQILQINEIVPFYFDLLYNHNKYHRKDNFFVNILFTILKYPIRVSITISKDKNHITEYGKLFKEKLAQFKRDNPFFSSLYGPTILSVFYKPQKNIDVKDIDNFIREIVAPCFEDEFKPPFRMFAPTKEEMEAIKDVGYCNNLNGHIIGYDILKLPSDNKHNEGFCIIGFHMENHSDVIASLKNGIEEIINNV